MHLTEAELSHFAGDGLPGVPMMVCSNVVHFVSHTIALNPIKILEVFFRRFDKSKNAREWFAGIKKKHPRKSNSALLNAVKRKYGTDPVAYYKTAVHTDLRWDSVEAMCKGVVRTVIDACENKGDTDTKSRLRFEEEDLDIIEEPSLLVTSSEGIRIVSQLQREVTKNIYIHKLGELYVVGVDGKGAIVGESAAKLKFLVAIENDDRSSTKTLHVLSIKSNSDLVAVISSVEECKKLSLSEAQSRKGPFAPTGIIQDVVQGALAPFHVARHSLDVVSIMKYSYCTLENSLIIFDYVNR